MNKATKLKTCKRCGAGYDGSTRKLKKFFGRPNPGYCSKSCYRAYLDATYNTGPAPATA